MTFREKLERAFGAGKPLQLKEAEVMLVYLRLARLDELERFGEARDWASIRLYCPRGNTFSNSGPNRHSGTEAA